MDGVEVSVMACFINSCQCQPIHPSLVLEGQSCVYRSRCVLASSNSLMVLACLAQKTDFEVDTINGKLFDANRVEWVVK